MAAFSISFASAQYREGGTIQFTISWDGATSAITKLKWSIVFSGSLPTSSNDFPSGGTTGTVTIQTQTAAGMMDFTLNVEDDGNAEPIEDLVVRIEPASDNANAAATIGTAEASTKLADNDLLNGATSTPPYYPYVLASRDFPYLLVGDTLANTFALGQTQTGSIEGYRGNDQYIITRYQTANVEIIDTDGTDVVRFDFGVVISSVETGGGIFSSEGLITLDNGSVITIGSPTRWMFQLGEADVIGWTAFNNAIASETTVLSYLSSDTLGSGSPLSALYVGTGDREDVYTFGEESDASVEGFDATDTYIITRFQSGDLELIDGANNDLLKFDVGVVISSVSTGGGIFSSEGLIDLDNNDARITIGNPSLWTFQLGDDEVIGWEAFKNQAENGYTVPIPGAATNTAPTAADNTIKINPAGYVFSADDFGFEDADAGDTLNHITIVTLEDAGDLKLGSDADHDSDTTYTDIVAGQEIAAADIARLRFTPADGASGAAYTSFTFTVNDGTDDSTTANTITIDINSLPTAANNTIKIDPTDGYAFSATDFGFSDADAGDTLNYIIVATLPATGTLRLGSDADHDSGTTYSNVIANQQITMADIGRLHFEPAAGASGAAYASFTFFVNDGTADSETANTITIDINAAPVLANAIPDHTQAVATGQTYTYEIPANSFTDSDDATLTYTAIALDASNNEIALPTGLTLTGRTFSFTNLAQGVYTIRVTASDGLASVSDTFVLTTTSPNTAPTAADSTITFAPTATYSFSADDFGFSDANPGDMLDHITIVTLPSTGLLRLGSNDAHDATTTYTNVAANDEISAANIGRLQFMPASGAVKAANYASFTFTVNDGTVDSAAANTITIALNAVPTAADNTITFAPTASHTFSAADFGFADADGADSLVHITIVTLPLAGTLELSTDGGTTYNLVTEDQDITAANIGGLRFTPAVGAAKAANYASFTFTVNDGTVDSAAANTITIALNAVPTAADSTITLAPTATYTFSAADFGFSDANPGDTLDHITIVTLPSTGLLRLGSNDAHDATTTYTNVAVNDEISAANIGRLQFMPASGAVKAANYASFTFTVNDGTVDSAAANTITIALNAVPTAADNTITFAPTASHTFSAADFGFNDADGADSLVHITIVTLPSAGTLELTTDGGTTYNLVTEDQDITAANIGGLRFTPASGAAKAANYASFTFTVNDGTTDSAANTITIALNAVPTSADSTITLAPTASYSFTAADFGFTDTDTADALVHITIVTLPASGTLELSTDGGTTYTAVAADQDITMANIGGLRFTPAVGAVKAANYASFTFTVNDGTADSAAANTITINLNAVPTAADNTIKIAPTGEHVFSADDFGFDDADTTDSLDHITIASISGAGTLRLGSNAAHDATTTYTAVSANDEISAAMIGRLQFEPASGASSGAAYASFTFTVNDGTADSATANTITIDLNAAPVVANAIADQTQIVAADQTYTYEVPANSFSDADDSTLTYTAIALDADDNDIALPAGLTFTGSTFTFTNALQLGTYTLKVTASDGIASVSDTFDLTITVAAPDTGDYYWQWDTTPGTSPGFFRYNVADDTRTTDPALPASGNAGNDLIHLDGLINVDNYLLSLGQGNDVYSIRTGLDRDLTIRDVFGIPGDLDNANFNLIRIETGVTIVSKVAGVAPTSRDPSSNPSTPPTLTLTLDTDASDGTDDSDAVVTIYAPVESFLYQIGAGSLLDYNTFIDLP